jgi:hypothetical protein
MWTGFICVRMQTNMALNLCVPQNTGNFLNQEPLASYEFCSKLK